MGGPRLAANAHVEWSLFFEGELSPSLHDLQLIDTMACLERRRSRPPMLAMVDSLERLGPETHFKCIWGLNAQNVSVFREDDSAVLREMVRMLPLRHAGTMISSWREERQQSISRWRRDRVSNFALFRK
jgi:hypothetical protein